MISHVQQFGANGTNSSAFANVTKGNLLLCSFSFGTNLAGASSETCTISDTLGNVWSTAIGPFYANIGGNHTVMYLWYVKNLNATGSTQALIAYAGPGTAAFQRILLHEFSGLDPIAPLDQAPAATNGTGASIASNPATTLSANELLYAYGVNNSGNPVVGSGWTAGISEGSEHDEYKIVSSSGTYTATYTGDTSDWAIVYATFKGAGGAGPRALVGAGA
jgi:hypothetical protein